jgi:hypothetical protein
VFCAWQQETDNEPGSLLLLAETCFFAALESAPYRSEVTAAKVYADFGLFHLGHSLYLCRRSLCP